MPTTIQNALDEAARDAGLELRFRDHGEAYERAKAVADRLGVDVRTFLLLCIKEGHAVLKKRVGLDDPGFGTVFDEPAILRRPPPMDPKEREAWEEVRLLFK